ncbi:MAG: BsuBI/PstI family type II restriction endonuclease [Pirellulales bacterium]
MSKRDDALTILKALGLPKPQQNERSCLSLLALAGLRETDEWSATKRPLLRILDIMNWMKLYYKKGYAPNSRETVRRQTIHQFEQAGVVVRNPDQPSRATNSGDTVYQLTAEVVRALKAFGSSRFARRCNQFVELRGSLAERYAKARNLSKISVKLPGGSKVILSPGAHNFLQQQVVEEFAPRFAQQATVVYLGDTADKRLVIDIALLKQLAIAEMSHDKLPDVVLYDKSRNWLFLIEAVTSHGPVSAKRHAELEAMLKGCAAGRVYVTAFANFASFKKYASDIVWESEVWIAESPDHLIHFNGDRFLGPR